MTPESPVNRRRLLSGAATLGVGSLAGWMGTRGDGSYESIHWHINLAIEITGEAYPIPKNVGIVGIVSGSPSLLRYSLAPLVVLPLEEGNSASKVS